MTFSRGLTLSALALSTTLAFGGHALAGGANKVYSPYVSAGEWEVEHFGTYSFEHEDASDNYQYKSKTAIGYGLTDWWKVEVEGVLENEPGDNTTYDATEFVSKFQFWEHGEAPIDAGLYLAYEAERDSDKADKIEAFLIFAKKYDTSRHILNIAFEQEIGSKRTEDLEVGLSWQSLWKAYGDTKAGFEYYGEFGELGDSPSYAEQNHQLGPVVAFEVPNTELEVKLGYLAGISSDAFDSTFKWELEYEF